MAVIPVDVAPDVEEQLQSEAKQQGMSLPEYAGRMVAAGLASLTGQAGRQDADRLPVRGRQDIERLALAQGVEAAHRFEDLLGAFWPPDENADEFVDAVRRWRREGHQP